MTVEDACAMVRETLKPGFNGSITFHANGAAAVCQWEVRQVGKEKPKTS
jgi:hypothetical protein